MISPGNRLLIWVTILLPFAALAGVVPSCGVWVACLFGALGIVALADGLVAAGRRGGIEVTLPDVVRMSLHKPGAVSVVIERSENARGQASRLRVGLPLPDALESEQDALEVALPGDSGLCSVDWPCVPRSRGQYIVDRCFFEVLSPLGFWHARGESACRSEIRVYPSLMPERRKLAAFFLNRGNFGLHTQRTVGQGKDFEKLREYIPGDSYDDIHWKATAKRGRPVTKLYQVERTQEIYVLIDSSRMSGRTVGAEAAIERYLASALVLGLAAEQQGDLFGLMAFGSRMHRFIKAGGGKAHYHACRDAIYTLSPEIASPDFDELFTSVRLRLRRRSLLVILTDLGDPGLAQSFLANIDMVCRQHVVLVCMLKHPSMQTLFSNADAETTADVYGKLGGQMILHNVRELEKALHHKGVRFTLVEEAKLSTQLVSEYMNVKARQML